MSNARTFRNPNTATPLPTLASEADGDPLTARTRAVWMAGDFDRVAAGVPGRRDDVRRAVEHPAR